MIRSPHSATLDGSKLVLAAKHLSFMLSSCDFDAVTVRRLTIDRMVEQNLTSALILEDDADWDIRIKSQMRDFAKATQMLVQPLAGTLDKFVDPTHDGHYGRGHKDFYPGEVAMEEPVTSPYGDVHRWDVLFF